MTTTGGIAWHTPFSEVVDLSNRTKLGEILGNRAVVMLSLQEQDFNRCMNPNKPFWKTEDELLIANWVLHGQLVEIELDAACNNWSGKEIQAAVRYTLSLYVKLQMAPYTPGIPEALRDGR